MTYNSWLRRVRKLLDQEGFTLADFAEWDWPVICEEGHIPEAAVADALRELAQMSDADPGLPA